MKDFSPPSQRTPQERAAVTAYLQREGGEWVSMPPDYTTFSRTDLSKKLEQVRDAVLSETDSDAMEVETAYLQSQQFVDSSFDFHEGKKDLGRRIGRAFVVPMRSNRRDDDYASESTPFYPLLDPVRFGVVSEIRMRTMYGLPPTILDTYLKSDNDDEAGALVLSPMYTDMISDIRPNKDSIAQKLRLIEVGGFVLSQTAVFANKRLGADVIGLGATLPKVTHFGHALRSLDGMENLTTTTGHGGTVFMIVETARKILETTSIESDGKIGVIGGAGSIGWSSTVTALEQMPDHHVISYDIDRRKLWGHIGENVQTWSKVDMADSARRVLERTNIIITAVTGRIDLDDPEYEGLDLTGKVIIDDSQPGCFNAEQVEARGGKLVWVVGEDSSDNKFVSRDGYYTSGKPYTYGESSGLYGPYSEFACGQEAAVIARSKEFEKAVTQPVNPAMVKNIGRLMTDANLSVAPFQAFGKPVSLPLKRVS